jgi:hypothetical protein
MVWRFCVIRSGEFTSPNGAGGDTLATVAAFPSPCIQLRIGSIVRYRLPNRCLSARALLLRLLHFLICGFLFGILFISSSTTISAVTSQKLYMKDGTCQIVSSYEVHGDRVRYFSVERGEWEEIPTSLVDFDATKRSVDETKALHQKQIEEAKELEKVRFSRPPEVGFEITPGLRLPGDDGVFTVEGKRVVRLAEASGEAVTDKKRAAMMLAVPLPVLKARALVLLEGPKATIRLNDPWPVFYVQSAAGLGTRLELIRVKEGKSSRVLENVDTARGKAPKTSEERTMVSLERKLVAPNIYALKPFKPLEAGEYALGEVVDDKLRLDVYDFGYDKWVTVK